MITPRPEEMDRLVHLARLAQDRETRRFSAFRSHVMVLQAQVDGLRCDLDQSARAPAPTTIAEARHASAYTGEVARALGNAAAELERLSDKFESARRDALRAFGRAEVMRDLVIRARAERREKLEKRV
ncbi:hypothetical protein [Paracoccus pacificus]|uniref:Uncharacterized protein n=1 Tax=Paracoccus pacificus TaxID=1463598 RepID=A0ABW4RD97_9RHOB